MSDQLLLELLLELKDEASQGFQHAGQAANDYNRQVNTAKDANGGLFSGIGGGLAKFGMMATGVGAVTSAISGLASNMLDGNAQMESYATQFEVLTGSAENAGKMMEDLQTMGAKTPFEFTDLAAGTQTLLAFGRAQSDVIPDLQMLGDISGGNAQKMQSLATVYGQVASNGKLMGGDLLQMINAGFNPLNIIAKQTGESMSDLRDRMSAGKVSFEEVRGAMQTATSEGGQFFGMMDKQSGTFSGLTSTLSDNFATLQRAVMAPIFDVAKQSLEGLITVLSDPAVMAGVTAVATALANGLGGAVQFIGTVIQAASPFIGQIITFIQGLLEPTTGASSAVNSFGQAFSALNTMATENLNALLGVVSAILVPIQNFFTQNGADIMTTVNGWMSQLGPLAQGLLEPIGTIVQTIFGAISAFITEHSDEITAVLTMAWQTISTVVDGAITIIRDVIIPALQNIATFISEHSAEIQAIFSAVWTTISGIVTGAMDIIQGVIKTVTSLLKGDWQGVWDGIVQILKGAMEMIQGSIQGTMDLIKGILTLAWDAISGKVTEVWNGITTAISGAWTEITTALGKNIEEIKTALGNNLNEIKTSWETAWNSVSEFASKLWTDIQTAVSTAFDNVKKTIGGFLGGVQNTLVGIGTGIVDGITKGISNAGDAIKNKLMEMAKAAWDAVTDFLGIHSPSTKGIWAGEMLGGGFELGVDKKIAAVTKKANALAQGAMSAITAVADHHRKPLADLATRDTGGINNTSSTIGAINLVVHAGAGADGDAIGVAAARALSRELALRQRLRGQRGTAV